MYEELLEPFSRGAKLWNKVPTATFRQDSLTVVRSTQSVNHLYLDIDLAFFFSLTVLMAAGGGVWGGASCSDLMFVWIFVCFIRLKKLQFVMFLHLGSK